MTWLNRYRLLRVFTRPPVARSSRKPPARLRVEPLEARLVPATFTVTPLGPLAEGGGAQAAFRIDLVGGVPSTYYTVDYATADGTATSGSDYTAATSAAVYFDSTNTSAVIYVTVLDDGDNEADETFTLELSNPVNADVGDTDDGVAILDDDLPAAVDDAFELEFSTDPYDLDVLGNDDNLGPVGFAVTDVSGFTGPAGTLAIAGDGLSVTFTPPAHWHGSASFAYTVTDAAGDSSSAVASFTVDNAAPEAVDDTYHVAVNGTVIDNVLDNDTDADGDPLTVTMTAGPSHGSVTMGDNGEFEYTPDAGSHESDSFTYLVEDGYGGSDFATAYVTVDNAAPVAVDDSYDTAIDAAVEGNVLENDSDADGDLLTAAVTTDPDHGSVSMSSDGHFAYTPEEGYHGWDSFAYEADDGYGGTSAASVIMIAVDTAPVAVDDGTGEPAYHVAAGGSVSGNVLDNDYDPDGDALAATVTAEPSQGTVTLDEDGGGFEYTPNAGAHGDDSFTYEIDDGYGGWASATVYVTIDNTDPVAVDDGADEVGYHVAAGGTVSGNVRDNDSDADGDTLVVTLTGEPTLGTVTLDGDGGFEYTPNPGARGGDSFTYEVDDGYGGTSSATVYVTIDDIAPVAVDDGTEAPGYHVAAGGSVSGSVLTNDSDADGDTLTATVTSDPSQGSVFMGSDGGFTYTPNAGAHEGDSFTYVIGDGYGGWASATVYVTIDNTDPVAVDDEAHWSPGDGGGFSVRDNDTDADGDTLSVTLLDDAEHGTVTMNSDGTFDYAPTDGYVGKDGFRYQVDDGYGGTSSAWVSLTVSADKPFGSDSVDCGCEDTGGSLECPVPLLPPDVNAFTGFPVRNADGTLQYATTDIASAALGGRFGVTRSWTNDSGAADPTGAYGANVTVTQTAFLKRSADGSQVAVVFNGVNSRTFLWTGSGYAFGGATGETLTHADGRFVMTDATGRTLTFFDFDAAPTAGQRGRLEAIADSDGLETAYGYDGLGRTTSVVRTLKDTAERLGYTYENAAAFARVAAIELQRTTDGGATWAVVQSVAYTYYGGDDDNGSYGDLRTAEVFDAAAAPVETKYYRYYHAGDANGFDGALKFVVSGAAYAQLAALGTVDELTDAEVAPYADNYFEYDGDAASATYRRVVLERAGGAGCSVCSGGQGEFEYAYTVNAGYTGTGDLFNQWKNETVTSRPDGSTKAVYTNAYGQAMLALVTEAGESPRQWIDYYRYDEAGRLLYHAAPSAVTGYDEAANDLVDFVDGNAAWLADDAGLFEVYAYGGSTTATDTAEGDVAGYLKSTAMRHGEAGADVPQSDLLYESRTAAGAVTFWVTSVTRYRNDDGTGAQTTTTAYAWVVSTQQLASTTTTLPVVTADQNGSDTAASTATVYDANGRPSWSRDAAGVLTYVRYDPATGAVVKVVADVDTSLTSDFADLPAGWSTPAGAGQHLVSTFEGDVQGRTTKSVDPLGHVTYVVYNDAAHEVRVYAGWDAATNAPTGPTSVTRDDPALGYTETLTMSAAPDIVDGVPTGTEDVSGIQSLSRSYRNAAGQIVYSDEYFDLTGVTYSTAANIGTQNTNFYRTEFAYGKHGQLNKTVSPAGTIVRTEIDALGRTTTTWVGTDDSPDEGYWSPDNLAGTDMVKVAETEYDNGGVGDSNATRTTQFTNGASPDRVTEALYDWRGRSIAVKGGVETSEAGSVNRPLTLVDYDNLGEVTRTRTFDGDGVGAGLLLAPPSESDPYAGVWGVIEDGTSYVTASAALPTGGLVLAGVFSGTVDFDPGSASAALSSGDGAYFMAEYTAAGDLVWVTQGSQYVTVLAPDDVGDVYALGNGVWKVDGATGATDWAVAGAGLTGLAVDAGGGVYAVGYFVSAATIGGVALTTIGYVDGYVWKLDAATGATDWVEQAGGSGGYVSITGVAVDGAGGVVVASYLEGSTVTLGGTTATPMTTDGYAGIVWHLDGSTGETDWVSDFGGTVKYVGSLVADGDGNVYAVSHLDAGASSPVVGTTTLSSVGTVDGFVWKFDAATGDIAWVAQIASVDCSVYVARIAVDAAGDVAVVGTFSGADLTIGSTTLAIVGATDGFFCKLDGSTGTPSGVEGAGGTAAYVSPGSVVVDVAGNIYSFGSFSDTATFGGLEISPGGGFNGFAWWVLAAPSPLALLRAETHYAYDELGQLYKTETYAVDPDTGAVGDDALTSQAWYDDRGQVVKATQPGGLVQKTVYDSLGRPVVSFLTDGGGDAAYADAFTVTGDTVLAQTEFTYDANGNTVETVDRQRLAGATGTGELGTATTGVHARVTYSGAYYDRLGRMTAAVDVGTNGGTAWTMPGSVPTRGDAVLVTSVEYDAAGYAWKTTDSMGVVFVTYHDLLGRTTESVENYISVPIAPLPSENKRTTYEYGPAGLTKLIAWQSGIVGQETEYVYGVTVAGGSGVNSNDVVGATKWPDPTTGASSSGEQETVKINALGQVIEATDRNGTVHAYGYDALGRVVSDEVTTLGSGVDGAVMLITTAYDGQGNPYLVTSYDAVESGAVVNQVRRGYNGLGQLTDEWQQHGGAVDTETSPRVRYVYSELDSGNRSRLTAMIYPDGYEVDYNYDTGLDDTIGRLSSISDAGGTLESYGYLGLGTILTRTNGAGVVHTTTLDDLGRVASVTAYNGATLLDGYEYGYNRAGNRTGRTNLVNSDFDEAYSYDSLSQLTGFSRGSSTSRDWGFDALGNRTSVTTDGGAPEAWSANAQNEITGIGGATTPAYDANGNMSGDETGRTLVYDAWNRLVQVKSGSTVLKAYGYDGLYRKVTEDDGTTVTDLYYSAAWQVLEEQVGGTTTNRYVWSPVYVDALVLRDRDTDADGTLDERLWAVQDANWNVTALVDDSGTVVEQYAYDPFGAVTVYDASYAVKTDGSDYSWVIGFQGKTFDAACGLYTSRERWYSPTLGRWITVDPLRFTAQDVNLYRAVANNPAKYHDPRGLKIDDPVYGENGIYDPKTGTTPLNRDFVDYTLTKSIDAGTFEWQISYGLKDSGIDIRLSFIPNPQVTKCKQIGFIQTVHSYWVNDEGKKVNIPPRVDIGEEFHTPDGWRVDHLENEKKPFYNAMRNEDNTGWTRERDWLVGDEGENKNPDRRAMMTDSPTGPARSLNNALHMDFEVMAINLETNQIIGGVKWGFSIAAKEDSRPIAYSYFVDKPSKDWLGAVGKWNDVSKIRPGYYGFTQGK